MATRNITLKGEAHWAKVYEGNRDMQGFEGSFIPFDGCYTIELDMDADNLKKLKEAKSAARLNTNGRVKFKRKHKEAQDWLPGGEPSVTKDGEKFTDMIPNGSIVEVDISVYDTRMTPGTRLEAVRILKLAEMEEKEEPTKEKETADAEGDYF